MNPTARKNALVIEKVTGELFIKDLENEKAIHLNPTSAYVWEKCDGRLTTHEIANEMETELGMKVSETVVSMAIEKLLATNLLEPRIIKRVESRKPANISWAKTSSNRKKPKQKS